MQVTTSIRKYSDFPVYQKVEEGEINEPIRNYEPDAYRIFEKQIKKVYGKRIINLSFDEYKILKSQFKIEESEEKNFLFSCMFIENSYNEIILEEECKEINKNNLSKNRASFVWYVIKSLRYNSEEKEKIEYNKCKALIKFGEKVNSLASLYFKKNVTPLDNLLDFSTQKGVKCLSLIQLLIMSGGVVHNPLTRKLQDEVNKIMLPIIDEFNAKFKVTLELLHDKNSIMNFIPKELRDIIHVMSFDSYHPEVLKKILAIKLI